MGRRPRLQSIDLLRGIVMLLMALMALDHTRTDFGDVRETPEHLATTTLLLFLAALVWPCMAFARLKRRSDAAWLSYL